jgi:hypothetical protein
MKAIEYRNGEEGERDYVVGEMGCSFVAIVQVLNFLVEWMEQKHVLYLNSWSNKPIAIQPLVTVIVVALPLAMLLSCSLFLLRYCPN